MFWVINAHSHWQNFSSDIIINDRSFQGWKFCNVHLESKKNTKFIRTTLRTLHESQTFSPGLPISLRSVQCTRAHATTCKGLLIRVFQNPASCWGNTTRCGAGAKIKSWGKTPDKTHPWCCKFTHTQLLDLSDFPLEYSHLSHQEGSGSVEAQKGPMPRLWSCILTVSPFVFFLQPKYSHSFQFTQN